MVRLVRLQRIAVCTIVGCLLGTLLAFPGSEAVAADASTWAMFLAIVPLDSAAIWHGWFEGQQRWQLASFDASQTVLRTAIGRNLGSDADVWAGYAWVPVYRPRPRREHRLWQQAQWRIERFVLRFRSEERFYERAGGELRLRFQARATLHVGGVPVVLSDEVFVIAARWDRSTPFGYEQNRLQLRALLPLVESVRLELGYLHIHFRNGAMQHVARVSVVYQPR
jgi:hypothetical protein